MTTAHSVIGKGDKPAVIPMTKAVRETLLPLRGQHFEYVFTYANQRTRRHGPSVGDRVPIPANNLTRTFSKACAMAGVTGLRFHDLRHTFGSRVTRVGGIRVAKELLRHADVKTTMRYAHVLDQDARTAMEQAANVSEDGGKIAVDLVATFPYKGVRAQ